MMTATLDRKKINHRTIRQLQGPWWTYRDVVIKMEPEWRHVTSQEIERVLKKIGKYVESLEVIIDDRFDYYQSIFVENEIWEVLTPLLRSQLASAKIKNLRITDESEKWKNTGDEVLSALFPGASSLEFLVLKGVEIRSPEPVEKLFASSKNTLKS